MIDRLIDASIRHRVLVILCGIGLAVGGAWAALRTPIDAIPDLSENQVIVWADWPGHGPVEVDAQVAFPLSAALRGLEGVRVIRSSSEVGYAWLSVIFEEGTRPDEARRALTERLAERSSDLPAGVRPRLGPNSAATGQIFWYTVEGGGLDLGRLRALQDFTIKGQLAAVPGVAEVASVGGWPIEFHVDLDPVKLRALGLTSADVRDAVARSDAQAGAGILVKAGAEYVVRTDAGLGNVGRLDPSRVVRALESVTLARPGGGLARLTDVAAVSLGPGPRRGSLEKDGSEAVGGVVLMTQGENPRDVTRRLKERIKELSPGLPRGVRIVPFYDRTPLIEGAVRTVSGTVIEAMITSFICVLLVLLHLRAAFVIGVTLPLAALGSFALMHLLRATGVVNVQTNIMSLAGIAISIGVLVDSSIVVTENAMHRLRERFGDEPARGDIREVVAGACREVGRPIFFSILIMLLSFLPVFALGGMEGRMFHPLAVTKSLALATVAVLSITLVPALCTVLLKGRMRSERSSPIVRAVVDVYRPILTSLLDRPAPLVWVLAATALLGTAPIGLPWLFRAAVGGGVLAVGMSARTWRGRSLGIAAIVALALLIDGTVEPLGREFLTPLDEGMVMDMPISIPRASIGQSTDDLKARDMVLCRFPEVDMVVGKAGRAETPTDPAPPDMIETMVGFRPRELWPRRKMRMADAEAQANAIASRLISAGVIAERPERPALAAASLQAVLPRADALLREYAYQRYQEFSRGLGRDPASLATDGLTPNDRRRWAEHARAVDRELPSRAAETFTRLMIEDLILRAPAHDPALVRGIEAQERRRSNPTPVRHHHHDPDAAGSMSRVAEVPADQLPPAILEELQAELAETFARSLVLWKADRTELIGFGGELDRAVPMPGWTNVWTMPIQNRVDMLATGVNTTLGVRVLGRSLDDVVATSEAIAAVLKRIPGAADVVADPIRGKGTIDVRFDRTRASPLGVDATDVAEAVEMAVGGTVATTVRAGRERYPVRVRLDRDHRADEESLREVLVAGRDPKGRRLLPLVEVADVVVGEGPAVVKAEDGLLRNYVRLNVRGRATSAFLDDARRAVAERVKLPEGTFVEWTGQFEHEARARATLGVIVPAVLVLILLVLYATYRDWADAFLILLTVPGAILGGVIFQWVVGERFSVTVWVGYIACFGMATSTGIIMLVYLREAVTRAGGLARLTPETLRAAVLEGAVQRLRPKLLTEGTTILGLMPMLWATGVGAEVIRPMAAPVLGGLLVADEVIDLLIPVLFYRVRLARLRRGGRGSHQRPDGGESLGVPTDEVRDLPVAHLDHA